MSPHNNQQPEAEPPPARPVGSLDEEAQALREALRARSAGTGTGGLGGLGLAVAEALLGAGTAAGGSAASGSSADGEAAPATCTCGAGTPQVCRSCPLCRVKAAVEAVSPDALEKLADIVSLAVTGLRDLAEHKRHQSSGAEDA